MMAQVGVQKGVATEHPGLVKYHPKWKRCRDVSDGQDAVHQSGVLYLPKLKDQTESDYNAYRLRAGFYNASWRTLGGLLGMMFRKPPKIELPKGIDTYLPDVDLAGTSLDTFARTIALETLEVGRVGILVDHPPVENVAALTVAAAQEQGLRPAMQIYLAECIINWKCRRIRNRHRLSLVVLKEMATEPDGEFAEKQIDQYRVLDLDEADQYRIRIFHRVKEQDVQIGGDVYPLMNGQKLDYIPFAIVGVDGIDDELDEPPLIDLFDLNLSHYRTNADYEHGCHFTGLPTPYVCGFSPPGTGKDGTGPPEKLYIGSSHAWVFTEAAAKVGFLEFTGQGLDSLKANLDRKEQQMAILGARMLAAEKKQAETATTTAIHRTGENSVLSAIAMAVSEALEWSLGIFCQWAGQAGDVTYQLNRDYLPAGLDAQQLTALLANVQAGKISDEEYFDLLQRGDVIDSEIKFDEHQAQIDIQGGPAKPDPNAAPKPGEAVAA